MTYTELKTAIADYLHRDDLTSKIDLFIDLFEARASRKLRTIEMEVLATVVPTGTEALPTGFQAFKNIQVNSTYNRPLEYASPQKIASMGITGGSPLFYTINGNAVDFSPSAVGYTIEWTYYQNIPALSDNNTSNWLLTKYPDYYLMGCVYQALIYTLDANAMAMGATVETLESEITTQDKRVMSGPITVIAA